MSYKNKQGISLLIIVVVIGLAALIMAVGSGLLGIGGIDNAYKSDQTNETLSIADGCMDEALRRIRINSTTYSGSSLSLGDGSCIIGVETSGSDRTITVTSTIGSYQKKIQAELTLSGRDITMNSWQEVSN